MNALLQQLETGLEALGDALDHEDYARAGDLMAEHDRCLRRYVETAGRDAPLESLRGLLRLQHALALRMRRSRDAAADRLRAMRQSGEAARAYAEAAP